MVAAVTGVATPSAEAAATKAVSLRKSLRVRREDIAGQPFGSLTIKVKAYRVGHWMRIRRKSDSRDVMLSVGLSRT